MIVSLDSSSLEKKLLNIVKYSVGFIDGVERGKTVFLKNLGQSVIEALALYIDSNARLNSEAMHHVYEWYRTGSPDARLFDLNYTISNLGLSVKSSFRQSNTVSQDSNTPFYNKAKIMELGVPVVIKPKKKVLVFEEGGKTVFTRKNIKVNNPGGTEVRGSYERTFDSFFTNYFSQAFLRSSGLFDYIKKPVLYKKNIAAGAKQGRALGLQVGYTWIANAKIGIE